ncbi:SRPBCC family protein [Mycobacterium sp. 852002-51057_SCH5723018]|uniref:SRPBCC family protein n=1 Tax=Mycobacterium sp. 852002-51057_SCH5723018 TaxID=1834094 RepID=UPI0007FD5AA7|nr:SRPBCC family protein [Mycobacterium sp. 852002-51057_SCH5723018]OBG28826.1 polyketide cyclase [Mycobacterium sp. 852002-51057_SCH5723018]
MITESSVAIDAPASLVWEVFTDVERWPEWTASVTELVGLDGPELAVGKRFQIKQPKLPTLVWQVTDLEPGVSWSWAQRSAGGSTRAHHTLSPLSEGGTLVRQTLDPRGPIGAIVGRLMRGTTRRYLAMEAQGLKARSEELRHSHGPAS